MFGLSDSSEILVKAVAQVISSYEDNTANSKPSIQDIADQTLSGYTTINEIKRGKLKSLSVKKALEISKRLGGPNDLAELVALGDETKVDEAKEFSRASKHLYPYLAQAKEYEIFFKDKEYARIIWAAFDQNNITRKEVTHRWGQEGIERLEILLESGLLIEDGEEIKGNASSASFSVDSAYQQLGHAYELYNPRNRLMEQNWASIQTQSVNEDFIRDFRETIRAIFIDFNEKSDSFKYRGNKRMYFGMLFDRYMPDLNDGTEILQ